MSVPQSTNGSESEFEFIETPRAATPTFEKFEECGVRTTNVRVTNPHHLSPSPSPPRRQRCLPDASARCNGLTADLGAQYPSIKNAPLPADAAGTEGFSNALLFSLLALVPMYLSYKIGGGWKTSIFFALLTFLPILVAFWSVTSTLTPRRNEKVKYPGRPVEHYLTFHKEADRLRYRGKNKIPMETFHEMYFAGDVDFKGDCLEVMEYRHDWASFRFTIGLFKFFLTGMMPEVIMHTRSQGESSAHPSSHLPGRD